MVTQVESAEPAGGDAEKRAIEPSAPVRVEADAGAMVVMGSVVVFDAAGTAHSETNGEMELGTGEGSEPLVVAVEGGRFLLELEEPADVTVASLVLDGRPARLPGDSFEAAPMVELRATWSPAATLRVVDAASRRDLTGVQVLRGLPIYRGRIHPGTWQPEHEIVRDAASPLSLPPVEGVAQYWVRADGYAWASVEFEHEAGGERLVTLQPAAKLVVHLDAFESDWNLAVRVYPANARQFGACLAEGRPQPRGAGGAIEFEGLRAGLVRVDAHFGNWWDPPVVAARDVAELTLSRTEEVSLRLDPHVFPEPAVAVAGTLRLPAGFEGLDVGLQIRPAGGPPLRKDDWASIGPDRVAAAAGDGRLRRWDLGQVTPGPYVIIVEPLQIAHHLDVSSPGCRDVHIEIAELAEVFVRVIDETTLRPAAIDEIAWGRPTPRGLNMWTLEQVEFDEAAGGYTFVAPLGDVSVSVSSDRYQDVHHAVRVQPGSNRVELTTGELPHRYLRLMDGDAIVPVAWTTRVFVESVDGDGEGRVRAIEAGRAKLVAPSAGRYEVRLGPVPGFEPVAPLLVVFSGSETDEVVVPLRRAR